ncbi:MAG TPA: OmpH family outer membrane protein [Kiritimatiellia bacterium]|nr:OmpH family outer membrane protein [Kiritimatiellia bacterium]
MKKLFGMVCVVLGLSVWASPVEAQAVASAGIVFADMESVFTNFFKTRTANEQLQEQVSEMRKEREGLVRAYEAMQEDYQAKRDRALSTALNEDTRASLRREAEEKLIEMRDQETKIRRFDEMSQKRLDEQSLRMRRRLLDEINEKVAGFAKEKGYQAIIDTSGLTMNGIPPVVYVDTRFDITAQLVTMLNN